MGLKNFSKGRQLESKSITHPRPRAASLPQHLLCSIPHAAHKVSVTFLELPWIVFMSFKQRN